MEDLCAAIKHIKAEGILFDDKQLLEKYALRHLVIKCHNGVVTLSRIETLSCGQGDGSRFMGDLIRVADKENLIIALTPDTVYGASSVSRLKRFYRRFGFHNNKGKWADMRVSESMLRQPAKTK